MLPPPAMRVDKTGRHFTPDWTRYISRENVFLLPCESPLTSQEGSYPDRSAAWYVASSAPGKNSAATKSRLRRVSLSDSSWNQFHSPSALGDVLRLTTERRSPAATCHARIPSQISAAVSAYQKSSLILDVDSALLHEIIRVEDAAPILLTNQRRWVAALSSGSAPALKSRIVRRAYRSHPGTPPTPLPGAENEVCEWRNSGR